MIDYDLVQIYGQEITNIFETQASFLLQDAKVIALTTTSAVPFFPIDLLFYLIIVNT